MARARGPKRLGAFARELASGKRPYEAAIAAGYPDGSCAQRNAQKRAARADVKAMVAELRAPVAAKLEITLAVLIERADQIFKQAMAAGQFTAAVNALKELGVLSGKRVERSERGEPGEFERMTDEELREAVEESARALGYALRSKETQH
jgi:phage terminase small subunit